MDRVNFYLAGDSTMSNYADSRAPRMGWGQVFHHYFTDRVKIWNEAASGRSSKTFIEEGRLDKIKNSMGQNDYLFIQFGHNDSKRNSERYTEPFTTYKANLKKFIMAALEKRAHPILITPVQRRNFTDSGKVIDKHGDYPAAMRELALELNVPLLDITRESTRLLEKLGVEASKDLFMWLKPGKYAYYPDGEQDNTHFTEYGAYQIAGLIVEEIRQLNLEITEYIR